MKIAIPVSAHDKHLLPALTDCLLKMGGLEEHPVVLFPTLSAKEAAYEAAERLGAQTYPFEQDFEGGAPIACNHHFAAVVQGLYKMGNTDPFLWMEPDMLPVVPRWADRLQNEYRMLGQPFMGNIVPTPYQEDGRLAYREGDVMMMGCGVYPAGMERDERIKPLIADLGKPGYMNPNIPFDVYLRWSVRTIGAANTELIADMWGTQNYRRAEGLIICDSIDHGGKIVRKREGAVSHKAVLVHGCKDGSLARLVLGKTEADPWDDVELIGVRGSVGISDEPLGKVGSPVSIPSEEDGDDDFWNSPQTTILATAPKPPIHTVAPVKTAPVKPAAKPAAKKPEPEPETKATPLNEITRAAIEKVMNGGKMRVGEMAEKFGVSVQDLAGTFSRNGYTVGHAGWVSSTIQITSD